MAFLAFQVTVGFPTRTDGYQIEDQKTAKFSSSLDYSDRRSPEDTEGEGIDWRALRKGCAGAVGPTAKHTVASCWLRAHVLSPFHARCLAVFVPPSPMATDVLCPTGPTHSGFLAASGHKSAEGMGLLRRPPSQPVLGKISYAPNAADMGSNVCCLTVRTLDKNEYQLAVAPDIPVLQLKTEVANVTSIDPESQVRWMTPETHYSAHAQCCCACPPRHQCRQVLTPSCAHSD